MSTKEALERYLKRTQNNTMRKKRYKKPEKEVEKKVMSWLRDNGFSAHVVESKAVYNRNAGRYLTGQTISGMSDIVGNDRHGHACFIELKAKNRRNMASNRQREFLKEKIKTNCFAIVCDSVEYLDEHYNHWYNLKHHSDESAKKYLLSLIPKRKTKKSEDSEKLGF